MESPTKANSNADPYCALASVASDEPIAGTATAETDVWIALEYNGPWGRKALRTCGLSAEIRARLGEWNDGIPRCRVQLIKRRESPMDGNGPCRLFVAHALQQRPVLLRYDLPSPAAVLELDLDFDRDVGLAVGERRDVAPAGCSVTRLSGSLVLVCTNGQRDRCCARFGLPVYRRFAELTEDDPELTAFESSHIGGHRFAPTLVTLPHGLVYGRVALEEVEGWIAAQRRGELYRPGERLRGRSCHAKTVQVAESLVRVRIGALGLEDLSLAEHHTEDNPSGPGTRTTARFVDEAGAEHHVAFTTRPGEVARPKGCGEAPECFRVHAPG